ncbi:hypothetical protein EVAR_7174_1 [Eumeta japonica]|uniref:Histone-lysine N-methyltransferase SETMAR n=1 Tax=Eumeta variegata TaxID=151549 RepID=A0A4C1U794_EUMVA|nr:hypothetical protein EVAR_7174_1 [Eumeta japonica]
MRKGRPTTASTDDNVSAVDFMIETDKINTYQQNRTSLGIDMTQVHKIPYETLAVKKFCTRWIPHNLTDAQKLRRTNFCREIMQRFADDDSNVVYNMVIEHYKRSWSTCNQRWLINLATPSVPSSDSPSCAAKFSTWLPFDNFFSPAIINSLSDAARRSHFKLQIL